MTDDFFQMLRAAIISEIQLEMVKCNVISVTPNTKQSLERVVQEAWECVKERAK